MHNEDDNISYDPSRVIGAHDETFDDDVEYGDESVVQQEEEASGPKGKPTTATPTGSPHRASIDLSKDIEEKDHHEKNLKAKRVKFVILVLVLGVVGTAIGFIVYKEVTKEKVCKLDNKEEEVGNGVCNLDYNTEVCEWDGGDCDELNEKAEKYPGCYFYANSYDKWGDGSCDTIYNTEICGWDLGDCDLYNSLVNCTVNNPWYIGDGECAGGDYNTEVCGFDGGDCSMLNEKYPLCTLANDTYWAGRFGNGICERVINSEVCGFDDGDCDEFNENFPNCDVIYPDKVGNGDCDGGYGRPEYNTEACGFDGGDCLEFNEKYPNCSDILPELIGDGLCHGSRYNTEACGFDGGDCLEFNEKYPNCSAILAYKVGDGVCDDWGAHYNTETCGFDGGDCQPLWNFTSD